MSRLAHLRRRRGPAEREEECKEVMDRAFNQVLRWASDPPAPFVSRGLRGTDE